jgi:drug/metabolite transporter (DMT)-like permease
MQSSRKAIYTGISLAIIAAIIWSGNFIIARGLIEEIPPVSLAFYRWVLATIIIFPFAYSQFRSEWPLVRRSWLYLFWASLTGISLFNTFVYVGAHYTSAINLALIGTTSSPIIATILARIFLKEKIGLMKVLGLLFCIAGVLFLITRGNYYHLLTLKFSTGDLWVLAAGFYFAVYNTLVKKKPPGISSMNFLFVAFALGTLLLLPFFLWELSTSKSVTWSASLAMGIVYLGVGASVICFWIWNIAIQKIGAARTILFGNLIPIFSSLGAVIFLGETFTTSHLIGMALVFTGIVIANISASGSGFAKMNS